jgi:hypothetical protein
VSDEIQEPIKAHVVLKQHGDVRASPDNLISDEEKARVAAELESLGFDVLRVSPLSILIQAAPQKYESVFKTGVQPGSQDSPLADLPAWHGTPEIPQQLSGSVEHVLFPERVELH